MTERIRYGLAHGWEQALLASPVLAAAIAWTVVVILREGDSLTSVPERGLLAVPLVLGIGLLLSGLRVPGARIGLAWMGIVAAAVYANTWVTHTYVMLGVPGLVIAAFLARRYPATFLVGTVLASSSYGTAEAFLHVSVAPAADVLMAGLWLGTIWSYLFDDQRRRTAPMTGMTLLALYSLLTFFEIFVSPYSTSVAAQDFRGSVWYMMSFMLLAVAPLSQATIRRAAIGFLWVALAVGGYATFRLIFGQSHQEIANSLAQTNNNLVNGKIRLFGSFVAGKELACWTAAAIPYCLACGLGFRGRVRWLALLGAGVCTVAMFGADVRIALIGLVPAVVLVFVLFQASRAFPGAHLGVTLGVLLVAAAIGIGGFAYALGGNSATTQRYKILLSHPTQDASYQARLFKWHDALRDISHHPLGQGLGTSGRTQQRFGAYVNISNQDVDNSYLKIALEQGAGVTVFYMAGLLLLLLGIGRRALKARSPVDATLAIAAAAVLFEFGILMFAGTYIEGLPALGTWLFIGLGVAGVTRRRPQAEVAATSGSDSTSPSRHAMPAVVPVGAAPDGD